MGKRWKRKSAPIKEIYRSRCSVCYLSQWSGRLTFRSREARDALIPCDVTCRAGTRRLRRRRSKKFKSWVLSHAMRHWHPVCGLRRIKQGSKQNPEEIKKDVLREGEPVSDTFYERRPKKVIRERNSLWPQFCCSAFAFCSKFIALSAAP